MSALDDAMALSRALLEYGASPTQHRRAALMRACAPLECPAVRRDAPYVTRLAVTYCLTLVGIVPGHEEFDEMTALAISVGTVLVRACHRMKATGEKGEVA